MRLLLLPVLALLAGCGDPAPEPKAPADPPAPAATAEFACRSQTFEGTPFTVCAFDASRDRIEILWQAPAGGALGSLAALEASLGSKANQVRFAMNAGMYDEGGAPIGLFVKDGTVEKKLNRNAGSGNFHLLPNGVFSVDEAGRVAVTPSERFNREVPSPRWATQSGPMLVIDGKLHPKFDANGQSQLVRNGVGVRDARTAFFVISEEGVSFGRFARFFRDALGCDNALYLDGTVSSLWDPATGRQDAYSQLGPMLVVFRG